MWGVGIRSQKPGFFSAGTSALSVIVAMRVDFSRASYGYSLNVTPLQIATAYARCERREPVETAHREVLDRERRTWWKDMSPRSSGR